MFSWKALRVAKVRGEADLVFGARMEFATGYLHCSHMPEIPNYEFRIKVRCLHTTPIAISPE